MANGRTLGSALMFDWLLGRAWDMAQISYANAERFGSTSFGNNAVERRFSTGGQPSIEKFLSRYAGSEDAALVRAHDRRLEGQMAEVARRWAEEFKGMISSAAPIGPGFERAVQWLGSVVRGGDGLGYLGQEHRAAQAAQYAQQFAAGVNSRGLPTPAGAMAALRGVAVRESALYVERAQAQMQADRIAQAHKLRVDAAEALVRARNQALDALMENAFTQMHLMFDVFGRNNDYLTKLQRQEQAIRARSEIRSAELASWESRIQTLDDEYQAENQKLKAAVERANTLDSMSVDANIRLLRRYASRAAAALNSVGISVNSTASESNNVHLYI